MELSRDTRFKTGRRAAAGIAVLVLAGCGGNPGGGEANADASSAASAASGVSGFGEHTTSPATPNAQPTPATHPAPRSTTHATIPPTRHTSTHSPSPALVREQVDNHNGALVLADNTGKPVADGLPSRIPYGTEVPVKCYEGNDAGLPSVTAFYEIGGGKWAGNVVVADVMTNGGPLGNTNSPNIDPAVRAC
jgi:hypothetical protein